ncbi:pentatricopeptide repeat-containing protein At2g01510, mitochondrial-like [Nymphaea colorata]|nr:pentatricopeptide repeat-containing protein At2g01510, mitochondrial-like [Nymphaea colorata]
MASPLPVLSSRAFIGTAFHSDGDSNCLFSSFSSPKHGASVANAHRERISSRTVSLYPPQPSEKYEICHLRSRRDAHYYATEIRRVSTQECSEFAIGNLIWSMDEDGFHPNRALAAQLLQACVRCSSYQLAKLAHGFLLRVYPDLRNDTIICNNLVGMYAKLGYLDDALHLFDGMNEKSLISWSAVISACSQSGYFLAAVLLFREMRREGLALNEFALGSVLKASSGLLDTFLGKQLHALSIQSGFQSDVCVRTALITIYSRCNLISDSLNVFQYIDSHDITSYNSMLAAYVQNGNCVECIKLFLQAISLGFVPNEPTYASVFTACSTMCDIYFGRALHGHIIKIGLFGITLGNSLITLYDKCGRFNDALKLFTSMGEKTIVTWNAVIAACAHKNRFSHAVDLFKRMQSVGIRPNHVTLLSILSMVASAAALKQGKEIHAQFTRYAFGQNVALANSLITMYAKCGCLDKAKVVFDKMPSRDVISWNAMLSAYVQNNHWKDAFKLFKGMNLTGIWPDDHTFTVILGSSSWLEEQLRGDGREFHAYILKTASKALAVSTSNALVTMYSNIGNLNAAEKIFLKIRKKDLYSWNAMMDGYSINGKGDDAIVLFLKMQWLGVRWDHLTLSILLATCSRLLSLELSRQFHAFVVKSYTQIDDSPSSVSVYNALISTYSKCGSVADAICVYERMVHTDVYSWTTILSAYAHYGMGHKALELFETMIAQGISPNAVTFLSLLTSCAHTGLVKEGIYYFDIMTKNYGIHPEVEHYACMVDLFGRSGHLEKAVAFIMDLPVNHGTTLWKVLLGSCHLHKELNLGIEAASRILQLEPGDETTYVLLSNIYAFYGMWEDSIKLRGMMKNKGLKKETGWSRIEIGNKWHGFVAGDVLHPHRKEIYEKLEETDEKIRGMGYLPMTELVLHDVDESQKEVLISHHSEKLAVCFGILQTPPSKPIRVIKNLRTCEDCHNWMNLVSVIEKRFIIMRDSRRFHCFKDGKCSCGDYW